MTMLCLSLPRGSRGVGAVARIYPGHAGGHQHDGDIGAVVTHQIRNQAVVASADLSHVHMPADDQPALSAKMARPNLLTRPAPGSERWAMAL